MAEIYVYEPNGTNFGTIGLCGALTPSSCEFEEVANGMSEITLVHPVDEYGKYKYLLNEYVIQCEVPVRTCPEIKNGDFVTSVEIWRVKATASRDERKIYKSETSDGYYKIVPVNAKITVVKRTAGAERYKAKYSKWSGWMQADALEQESEIDVSGNAGLESVVPSWEYRPQLFRIYSTEVSDDQGVTVRAKHISYDLATNITTYEATESVTLATVINGILSRCLMRHDFTAETNIAGTHVGALYKDYDPITAILDPDVGICTRWTAELLRDNYDLYLLGQAGIDRGVRIEYAKNLAGVYMTTDMSSVYTAIRPIGEKKNGSPLYLDTSTYPQGLVISDIESSYAFRRIATLTIPEAKVDGEAVADEAEARAIMLAEARKRFDEGIDKATVTVQVEFENLGNSDRYQQYKNLENIYLFDRVQVYHPILGIDVALTVTHTIFDVCKGTLTSIELGDLQALTPTVSTWQIAGSISGQQISSGAITERALATTVKTSIVELEAQVDAMSTDVADAAAAAAAAQSTANAAASAAQTAQGTATAAGTAAASAQSTADAAAGAVSALDTRVTALEGLEKRGSVSVSASSTGTLASLGVVTENGIYRISLAYQATTADAGAEYLFRYSGTGLSTFTRLLVIAEGAAARAPRLSSSGVLTLNSQAEAGTVRYRMNKIY